MPKHWDRILWDGSRFSHPCGEGTQERASILEDLRGVPAHARSYPRDCDGNAAGNTVWVRTIVQIPITVEHINQ